MDSASVLYFAHIPKTAGTTVSAALDAAFVPGAVLPARFTTELAAARDAFARTRCAHGHLGADLHAVLGRGGPTFTLLRAPVQRTLSHIAHVQRDPLHPLHGYVRERGHDVAGFVRDPLLRPYVTNLQARHLVQPAGTAAPLAPEFAAADHPAAGQVAYELATAPSDRALLAAARRALDAMLVVGTTDDVDGALRSLARALGWREPPRAERRNAAPEPIDPAALPADVREEIAALNRVDQALYEQARTRSPSAAPRGWAWHPWRTTADDAGWEAAEFDERRGWQRRLGLSGQATAVLDGPDELSGPAEQLTLHVEAQDSGALAIERGDIAHTLTVRGPAGAAVAGIRLVPAG